MKYKILILIFFLSTPLIYSEEEPINPWDFWSRSYVNKIYSLLNKGETVVMAIISEEFLCQDSLIPDATERKNFITRTENFILKEYTRQMVQSQIFAENENFAVVDRSAVSKILNELQFHQTGFVTSEMRNQLGKMLGVTHLLMITFQRTSELDKPIGYVFTDNQTFKLIEVKLGKILTIDDSYCHNINNRYTIWDIKTVYSTNILDFQFDLNPVITQTSSTKYKYKKPTYSERKRKSRHIR